MEEKESELCVFSDVRVLVSAPESQSGILAKPKSPVLASEEIMWTVGFSFFEAGDSPTVFLKGCSKSHR